MYSFVSLYILTRCIYFKVQSICKYTRIKFFSLIASRLLITLSYTNTDDKEVSGTHFKSSFFRCSTFNCATERRYANHVSGWYICVQRHLLVAKSVCFVNARHLFSQHFDALGSFNIRSVVTESNFFQPVFQFS
jgi:hypothetical protein